MSLRRLSLVLFATACAADGEADSGGSGSSSGSSTGAADDGPVSVTAPTSPSSADDSGSVDDGVSNSASDGPDPDGTEAGSDDGASSDGTTGASVDCPPDARVAGQYDDIMIEHDGVMRSYNLYVPAGIDGTSAIPLVLNMHGYLDNPVHQQEWSAMEDTADAYGFAMAFPAGLNNSWNAGACCGQSMSGAVDDVGFLLAVIEDVKATACIDAKRVYATGMSNGGFMSHRLACEAADTIAAIAPVAGVLGIPEEDCNPSRPVPVMHFHGTADFIVPYGGGIGFRSVAETIQIWMGKDGCTDEPAEVFAQDDVTCTAASMCDGDGYVELCTIEGGGHCWFGNPSCPVGTSTTTIDAGERMAEFFALHALP